MSQLMQIQQQNHQKEEKLIFIQKDQIEKSD
jgi:hypothetical protein